jgi:hypothetical protein
MAFFKALGYTPPSRRVLSSTLLDESYQSVKEDVQKVFRASPQLGIVADESTNITGDRIENVSVMCKGTSYHWANTYCADRDAESETAVESIQSRSQMETWAKYRRSRQTHAQPSKRFGGFFTIYQS